MEWRRLGQDILGGGHFFFFFFYFVYFFFLNLLFTLAFIGSIYTKTPYYKDDVKGEDNFALLPVETLRTYNCRDVMVTGTAPPSLNNEIDEYDVRKTFEQDMKLLRPLIRIQKQGVRSEEH